MKTTKDTLAYILARLESVEHQPAAAFVIHADDARTLVDSLEWETSIKRDLMKLQEQWVRERAIYTEALSSIAGLPDKERPMSKAIAEKALLSVEESFAAFLKKKP